MSRLPLPARRSRRSLSPTRPGQLLELLRLEDRSVPATISGTAYNDVDNSLINNAGDLPIAGATVFLDANDNGIIDTGTTTGVTPGTVIPLQSATPTTSTLSVIGTGTIGDVNVKINLTHSYDSDMVITLISPAGTRVELSGNNGGSGTNYIDTVFDDAAATSITAGSAPFTGTYAPEGLLSTLNGQTQTGTWTLEVFDNVAGDGGFINSWSVTILKTGETKELNTVTSSTGAYSFTGLAAGGYIVREIVPSGFALTSPAGDGTYRPTLAAATNFVGDFANRRPGASIYGNVYNDLDADGTVDAGENGQSGVVIYSDANGNSVLDTPSATVNSTNVPQTIGTTLNATATSTLTVSGLTTVADIDVKLSITHTSDQQLDIYLTSPAGTKIELSTDNGGTGDNYTNTVFSDEAGTLISAGTAPFTSTYRPEVALSTFDGQAANGIWTLTIIDDTNLTGGSLTAWSVTVVGPPTEAFNVSDSAGNYFFSGLAANTYTLRQQAPPAGQNQVFPVGGAAQVVTVAANEGKSGIRFGNRATPATLTGLAYSDANQNKTKDSGEAILANVTVFLDSNQNGVLNAGEASTITDGSGNYTFSVAPGVNYFVAALEPVNYDITAPVRNGLAVMPPVNTSKRAGDDTESTVTIDPTNTTRLFTASNTSSAGVLNASVSTNAGATWTNRLLPSGSDTTSAACCDANTAWDQYGNLWMVYLTDPITTALARSTDGGATFSLIQDFGASDHPSIAVGPSATAGQQTLAFQDRAGGGIRSVSMQINAAGVVGAIPAQQILAGSSAVGGNFGDIVIGPAGQVAVAYVNAGSGQGPDNVYFNIDVDGTGPGVFGAQSIITATNIGAFDTITPQPNRSVDAEPDLVWDTSGGKYNGRLYLVYNDELVNESNNAEVYIRFSTNSGSSWSNSVRVNDDVGTTAQFLPRIALETTTGNLAVSFYDARDDAANNKLVHYYGTASFDGGATWAPNVKLSTGQSLAPGGNDFGDYNDIDFVQGRFVTTWGDNSNSTKDNPDGTGGTDIYIGRVDVANNVNNHYIAGAVSNQTYSGLNFGFYTAFVTPPAKVTGTEFNVGVTQRSMVKELKVTFDQVVTAPVGAFTLINQKTSIPVNLAITNTDITGGFTVLTFGFTGGSVNGTSLADGRYTLGITASVVSNANGTLDGDGNGTAGGDFSFVGTAANKFYRLFGDINADGTVEGSTDFAAFGNTFGVTVVGSAFDFDDNGTIDGTTDFAEFGARFGITI